MTALPRSNGIDALDKGITPVDGRNQLEQFARQLVRLTARAARFALRPFRFLIGDCFRAAQIAVVVGYGLSARLGAGLDARLLAGLLAILTARTRLRLRADLWLLLIRAGLRRVQGRVLGRVLIR
jgi:hypothetical protein